jgi:hypothetical protein
MQEDSDAVSYFDESYYSEAEDSTYGVKRNANEVREKFTEVNKWAKGKFN